MEDEADEAMPGVRRDDAVGDGSMGARGGGSLPDRDPEGDR
jgi:hypothetical protein